MFTLFIIHVYYMKLNTSNTFKLCPENKLDKMSVPDIKIC